jgi:DNA polymerase-3 subunit alpha
MAALLSGDMPGRNFTRKDSLVEHMEDCQRMQIEVVPPDVNRCGPDFTVAEGKIFFGLGAIKGCGVAAAEAIVASRQSRGPIRSLFDLCERLDPGAVNRTAIESLVKAGALDGLSARRAQLFQVIDRALQSGTAAAADRRCGQLALFGEEEGPEQLPASAGLPDIPEWEHRDKLAKEKEVLGFYRSSHPLAEFQATLATFCSHTSVQAAKLTHRAEVMLGGMISSVKLAHTKNPRPGSPTRYAMFDLEDTEGTMRCILWPEPFQHYGEMVKPDSIVAVLGAVDKRGGGDEANLIVNELIPLEELPSRYTSAIVLRVREDVLGVKGLEQLYEILRGYPGTCRLQLVLGLADGTQVKCPCERPRVEITAEMRGRVEELLGAENVRLVASPQASGSAGRANGRGNGR